MAEFLVKMADERGHVLEQMENAGSEQEIRATASLSRASWFTP